MAIPAQTARKENRLSHGTHKSLLPQPCVLVIFGGDGDLSWRKLLPAIYNLNVAGVLPPHFAVVCFGLPCSGEVPPDPDDYIRNRARDGIARFSRQSLDDHWDDYARALFYVPGGSPTASATQSFRKAWPWPRCSPGACSTEAPAGGPPGRG